jgi:hypothetical protein
MLHLLHIFAQNADVDFVLDCVQRLLKSLDVGKLTIKYSFVDVSDGLFNKFDLDLALGIVNVLLSDGFDFSC